MNIKKYLLAIPVALTLGCGNSQQPTETQAPKEVEPTDPAATEIWEPVPQQITFNENGVPSDAVILFDGTNLDAWETATEGGGAPTWTVIDGVITVAPKTADIQTKEKFGSIQLHIEWSSPDSIAGESQSRGNSGIFLQNRYEVQVLDSYNNPTYVNGQAASIYKQHIPLANAMKSQAEWQIYDIIYHAPEFNEAGEKTKSATVTVIHNGVLVQDNVEIKGTTEYIGWPKNLAHGDDVLKLQDHGDGHNFVQYRNIWLRKL